MLIPFDIDAVTTERVKVVAVTTALGGSFQYLNETDPSAKPIKQSVSVGVARLCVKAHGNQFVIPRETCVLRYADRAISLEITNGTERFIDSVTDEQRLWTSTIETAWNTVRNEIIASGFEWFFDGRYAYTFGNNTVNQAVKEAGYVDPRGSFRAVEVRCYDLTALNAGAITRTCMAYYIHDDAWSISPPAWKSLTINSDESIGALYGGIDQQRGVNLNFALYAAGTLSKSFGLDIIEPLDLPGLMIEKRTVNLMSLDSSIKYLTQIDMLYTHALSWLIGLCRSIENLDQLQSIKSTIVYLTKHGFYDLQQTDLDEVMFSIPNLVTIQPIAANDDVNTDEKIAV